MFFVAVSACLASVVDEAPYCWPGEVCEMHRRDAATLGSWIRGLVTGRRAVTKADILVLTSTHDDAIALGPKQKWKRNGTALGSSAEKITTMRVWLFSDLFPS